MNNDWITLPTAPSGETGTGATTEYSTHLSPSPYNIPRACRIRIDSNGELAIDFRYIDEGEPTFYVTHSPGVIASLGKNSKRVFQFRFDKKLVQNKEFRVDLITNELKKLEEVGTVRFRDNYVAANWAVRSRWGADIQLIDEGASI